MKILSALVSYQQGLNPDVSDAEDIYNSNSQQTQAALLRGLPEE